MRVLITGGSGNIGTAVVRVLRDAGYEVRVFDRCPPRDAAAEFVEGSITDPAALERAMHGIEAVIHLAAIPAFKPDIPAIDFMHVNVTGTFNVLEAAAAAGVYKVVAACSDSALGLVFCTHPFAPDYLPIDEAHPFRPQDPYGLSKALDEELCRRAARRYGIQTICLRFCWVWFDDTHKQRDAILNGDSAALARSLWGYVDVNDVAEACRLSLECGDLNPGEPFYITSSDTYADAPTRDLIRRCYPQVAIAREDYFADPYVSLFDIGKARRILGYSPRYRYHPAR